MPQIYGSRSQYLLSQEKTNRWFSKTAFQLVFLITGIGFAATVNFVKNDSIDPNVKIITFAIAAGIFFYACYELLYAYSRNELFAKYYLQGSRGEDAVFAELVKLPNDYLVFRDIILTKGNIDFVVARSNQIFSIEVKSHSGRISFNGEILLKNGYPFREGDLINQTWREGKEVKEFLQHKLGHEVQVVSLLVFSEPKAYVDIDPWKPQKFGVYVLHARMLNKFLQSYHSLPVALNLPAITEFLKPHVKIVP